MKRQLQDVCTLLTDGTHYTPTDVGTGVPFLTVKDVSEQGLDFDGCSRISQSDFEAARSGNSAPVRGDVLFSKDGTVGKVHVVATDREFAVLSSLAILRPNAAEVDSRYLGHMLRTPDALGQATRRTTGSAIRRIVLKDLRRVEIDVPVLGEQQRIAAILDQADELRAKRRQASVQVDDLPPSVFSERFGDRGSIMSRWPTQRLGTLLEFLTSGSRGWAKHYSESGSLFLRIQNVRRNALVLDDIAFVEAPETAEARRTRVQPGDVLLSITADLGRTAVVPPDLGPAFINQHLSILRVPSVVPEYLSAFLASEAGQAQILRRNRQGVKAGLNFDDIRSFEIPLPPRRDQEEFARVLRSAEGLKEMGVSSGRQIESLFQSLQSRAFAGRL